MAPDFIWKFTVPLIYAQPTTAINLRFGIVFSQSSQYLLFHLRALGPAGKCNTKIQAFLAAYTDTQKSPRQSEISMQKQIKNLI